MKTVEWKKRVRPLLPADQEWRFSGTLCYRSPVHRIVLGVLAESSSYSTGVYIWRVMTPLYIPWGGIVLSWSERVGGGAHTYELHDRAAMDTAIRSVVYSPVREDEALARLAAWDIVGSRNPSEHEVVGYAKLLCYDVAGAIAALEVAASDQPREPWETERVERVQLVLQLLEEGGIGQAVNQLDRWCEQSATELGLQYARPEAD